MITGELKSKVDKIWNDFWSGGIANPLEVMEQLTYLLFVQAARRPPDARGEQGEPPRGTAVARRILPGGTDAKGRSHADLRWSRFKHFDPAEMFTVIADHVFPFLRTLDGEGSTYATHMRDARFTIPTPALLQKVVDGLDAVPMAGRDTKGDVYEYMLGKIATAGQNGQFRTPRHIIALMVAMTTPSPSDVICDPAAGTCGFLVEAGEYVRRHHPEALRDPHLLRHFHHEIFNGFDFDSTMLRIGSMSEAAQAGRPCGGDRARRGPVQLRHEGSPRAAPHPGRGPQARRHRRPAERRLSTLRRSFDRDPAVHQDQLRRHRPRLVLRPPG